MAKLLYSDLYTKNLDTFTNNIIKVINKRKDEGFENTTLDSEFMTGRDPTVLNTVSKALTDLGYQNNLAETRPDTFTISW